VRSYQSVGPGNIKFPQGLSHPYFPSASATGVLVIITTANDTNKPSQAALLMLMVAPFIV
jgi:hypothetical protein